MLLWCPRRYSMRSATKALSYRIAGRSFPIRCEYTFHSGGDTAAMVLTAIRTSRRVARSSVSRPEWSIPSRRDHQFPLLSIVDAQAPFAKLRKGYGRGRWANRSSSRIVPPHTVMRYETRTASTATERRAIETIHASYWKFSRHLFKIASALNRPKAAACATSSDAWER
jgi:hypothetical protein